MLYKCENCEYSSSIKGSFLKHQQRKTPCKKKATTPRPSPLEEREEACEDPAETHDKYEHIWEKDFIDDMVKNMFVEVKEHYSNYLDYLEEYFKVALIKDKDFRQQIYPFNDPDEMLIWYNTYKARLNGEAPSQQNKES